MGKIDKEKLLKEFPCMDNDHCVEYQCKHHRNSERLTVSECIYKIIKNFPEEPAQQIQKPREIPVKKSWTLKDKYSLLYNHLLCAMPRELSDIPNHLVEFYDMKEEPDYSAIPKGSIVEVQGGFVRTVERIEGDKMFLNDSKHSTTEWKTYNLIRVVEWAKEVTK